jgi:hypothetical protein
MRHYGTGLLDKHGGDAARRAHAEHYADLAVALGALAWGPEQGIALDQHELEAANLRTAFQSSLAADEIELAGRIAEAGWDLDTYSLDYEAVAWAEAACGPARARRLPVAITLLAIVAYQSHLHGDPSSGLAKIADAEQLAADWGLPIPLGVRMIKADLLAMHDPEAAVVVCDQVAAEARAHGEPGVVAYATWAGVLTRHYSSPDDVEAEARHAVDVCRTHGQPSAHATSLCALALVLVERDPVQARQLLDQASEVAAQVRDGFLPLRIQLIRARADIELARSSAGEIAVSAVSKVFDDLARAGGLVGRWELFSMAAHLLVHRPAADVATVVGIFNARRVENNRRQWITGVERARTELGNDSFERIVEHGAEMSDDEAVAFLCGHAA